MTEEDAKAWIAGRHGTDAVDRIDRFLDLVIAENSHQNLIAPSTIERIWQRHALDSAQLLASDRDGAVWLDIGTGGGFPGIVVAQLRDAEVVMVEPRRRRATFLEQTIAALELSHARVVCGKVERWSGSAGVISARAVTSLDGLFSAAAHCAGAHTRWILPKGRTARVDLDNARRQWAGMFHVEQSIVDPEAEIIIAEGVKRR